VKVTLIITNSDRAGAQVHVLSLLKGLSDIYEFNLIVGTEGFLVDEARKIGVRCDVVKSLCRSVSPINDYKAYASVYRLLLHFKPQLVHVHSAKASVIGRLAARRAGIKSIYTVHGWAFSKGNPALKRIFAFVVEKLMAPFTNKFVLVSRYDKLIALDRIASDEKLLVIYNGIEGKAESRNKSARLDNNHVTLICVARLSKQKNIPCLLRAMGQLEGDFRLQIVGTGPDELELKRLSKTLGVESKVSFLGESEEVFRVLDAADIFVLSSDWEGLPIAIIEALSAGLPVVATNVGGVSEIVSDAVNGFLVERDSAKMLADKISTLALDSEKRYEFSKQSKRIFLEKFLIEDMTRRVSALYNQVIHQSR